jgi:hypothetical protein
MRVSHVSTSLLNFSRWSVLFFAYVMSRTATFRGGCYSPFMPLYYFDIDDGQIFAPAEDGEWFPDAAAAQRAAVGEIGSPCVTAGSWRWTRYDRWTAMAGGDRRDIDPDYRDDSRVRPVGRLRRGLFHF